MSTAIDRVLTEICHERRRQACTEGYSPLHDDQHDDGSLAMAAACYAAPEPIYVQQSFVYAQNSRAASSHRIDNLVGAWPWEKEADKRGKHDRRRQLVIAAALLVAEIERLDRLPLDELRKESP